MSERTELQREILVTAYANPDMSQAEIADRVGCSASYVSSVLNEYDSYDAMEARIEQLGTDIGLGSSTGVGASHREKQEFEDFSLDDTPPIGAAVAGTAVAAFLLSSGNLIANRPLIRWGLILGSLGITLSVAALFYRRVSMNGLSAGIDWLLGNEKDSVTGTESSTDSAERTPPAPQSLKDDLYFERAEKQCEWCKIHVDSPDVHHITPRNEGGANSPDNLIVLCPNCHRKADRGVMSQSKLERAIQQ